MSYKLEKPYTTDERVNFVLTYSHEQMLRIEETDEALFALEANEIMENGEPIINPNFDAEQKARERKRLNMLSLTKADVLLALYQDKGITPDAIKEMLKDNVAALIKFDYASSYYRGDEVVIALAKSLGYTEAELDYLFENKKFPERIVDANNTLEDETEVLESEVKDEEISSES